MDPDSDLASLSVFPFSSRFFQKRQICIVPLVRSAIQGLVTPFSVVELEILLQKMPGFIQVLISLQVHFLILHTAPKPLNEQRPLPSILIRMWCALSSSVKTSEVNWLP